ncbi:MAG: ribonuclease HI family protein [Candidatus Daviesbacteria bacterium]|nr:ribonuclease HI family protein [Candidatus Daviesbacteria bacterium]
MKSFLINCDGASRGNPGQAAAGIVIQTSDGVMWVQDGIFLGRLTNNEAEYQAVQKALERLLADFKKDLPAQVEVRVDSLLIASQLSGRFKVKNEKLRVYYTQIKGMEKVLGEVKYTYTPREQNSLADKLANIALDRQSLAK